MIDGVDGTVTVLLALSRHREHIEAAVLLRHSMQTLWRVVAPPRAADRARSAPRSRYLRGAASASQAPSAPVSRPPTSCGVTGRRRRLALTPSRRASSRCRTWSWMPRCS